MRRMTDGEGYFKNDNRLSGGLSVEDGVLGCMHCHATILRKDIEKPKNVMTTYARCWHCANGPLCPQCGKDTWLYGHNHPDHERTWPHHLWINRAIDEVHRRKQLGV